VDETRLPVFRGCRPAEYDRILRAVRRRHVAAGSVVVSKGDEAADFFVIVNGLAWVAVDDRELSVLGPGDIFGELALLDGLPRSATVQAVTDLDLLTLSKARFDHFFDRVPGFRAAIVRVVAERVRRIDEREPSESAAQPAA
jgi:CRP-like cAMP-binding protein